MIGYVRLCLAFVIVYETSLLNGQQLPPRINIPGAVLVSRPPQGLRSQRPQQPLSDSNPLPPIRIRKPISNALPVAIPIREEIEESNDASSGYDEETGKLNLPAFQAVPPQARVENEQEQSPRPISFRPERPLNVVRQEAPLPQRPVLRQNNDNEQGPVRQPLPQTRRVVAQPPRLPIKPQQRPPAQEYSNSGEDNRRNKNRKPTVQILRKYRTDNEDGSITWGFENEDGTFKEENIGIDCIIRGKYGYIDPEGTRREYNYEAGNKCDPTVEEYPPEEATLQQNVPNRPSNGGKRPLLVKGPLQN